MRRRTAVGLVVLTCVLVVWGMTHWMPPREEQASPPPLGVLRLGAFGWPVWSPDGQWIGLNFIMPRWQAWLCAVPMREGAAARWAPIHRQEGLGGVPHVNQLAWSPDSALLVVRESRLRWLARHNVPLERDAAYFLRFLKVKTGTSYAVRTAHPPAYLSWSPDGRTLAYLTTDPDPLRGGVALFDVRRRRETRLYQLSPPISTLPTALRYCPAKPWLLAAQTTGRGEQIVWDTRRDSARICMVGRRVDALNFGWGPEGDRLYFVARDQKTQEATIGYVVLKDGSRRDVLTLEEVGLRGGTQPDFDSDCRRVALVAQRLQPGSRSHLYVLDLERGAAWQLTANTEDRWPRFSPDGNRIAFIRNGTSLWVVDAHGKNEKMLFAWGPAAHQEAAAPTAGGG